jgi:hypothetical protein
MFVNNEISERGILHRLLERASNEVTLDDRQSWAHSIDTAINAAATSNLPLRNRVARPVVVLAAAPALSAVAAALRDEDLAVSPEALGAVREFMTNGIDSPLYGRDPLAARRAADGLRRALVGSESPRRVTAAPAARDFPPGRSGRR